MDAKTLEALNRSIEKWDRNAVATTPDDYLISPDDCPLCDLFYRYWENTCAGCPVMEKTGSIFCRGTPYERASVLQEKWADDRKSVVRADRARTAAVVEADFLRSLLPQKQEPLT